MLPAKLPMNNSLTTPSDRDPAGKYSNFRDPIGLVLRMLGSKNRAAYHALGRAAIAMGVAPLDWWWERKERQKLAAANPAKAKQPLVFIVGPPRSGSTLLFQTLAYYADATYLTNLTSMFPRSPISCASLFHSYRQSARQSPRQFQNFYGQTSGFSAPNDGFEVWNRWLGEDRYRTPEAFDEHAISDMQHFFAAWTAEFDQPFINKNNRNAMCLGMLAEILPQATFVVIRREPLFVVQSLIEARLCVQGAKDRPWGLASVRDRSKESTPLQYVDDVCDQVLEIEQRLQLQLRKVTPARYIELTYEGFCQQPLLTLQQIAAQVQGLNLSAPLMDAGLAPFKISSTLRLSDAERQRAEQRLATSSVVGPHYLSSKSSVRK